MLKWLIVGSIQLFDASKRVNGFIFGLVGNRELANESKSWISFLLSLAIKTIQIHFSRERRFWQFTLFCLPLQTCKLQGYNDIAVEMELRQECSRFRMLLMLGKQSLWIWQCLQNPILDRNVKDSSANSIEGKTWNSHRV